MRETRGFTLLELLMVVIIIAILASIALPQYLRIVERARAAEVLQLMASIASSENRFRAEDASGAFTNDLSLLDADLGVAAGATTMVSVNWTVFVDTTNLAVQANRTAGPLRSVFRNLTNGKVCATDAIYQLPVSAAAPCP